MDSNDSRAAPQPDVHVPPWLVLACVGIGAFMATLDGSAVNVSLPAVRTAFGADIHIAQLVVTVYLLVMSALLLSFGRLGDLVGHRRVFLFGFALFGGASVLCGTAQAVWMLVLGRGIQAVGGACMQSSSPALLTRSVPAAERGRYLGLLSLFTYGGLTLGPAIGGALTQQLGWRSVFFVNLPICALGLVVGARTLPKIPGHREGSFDWVGAILWASALTGMLVGLGQVKEGHVSPLLAVFLGLSASLFVAFVVVELRRPAPMLDLRLFRDNTFAGATGAAFLNYVAVYAIMFLGPFRLIEGLSLGPQRGGLVLTAMPMVMAIAAPVAGSLSDRFGTRLLGTIGGLMLAFGLVSLHQAQTVTGTILALALCGLGTGTFISPNTSALLGSAPRERQGVASGVAATARTTGMVVGVAVCAALFSAKGGQPEAFAYALVPGIVAAFGAAAASALRPSKPRAQAVARTPTR